MNICQSIIVGGRLFADRPALIFNDRQMTYAQLEELSGKASQVLLQLGVQRGDRVAIAIGNVPAFAVWYFACLRLGGIAVALNTRLTGEEMAFIISDCDAHVIVGSSELLDAVHPQAPAGLQHQVHVSDDGLHYNHQTLAAIDVNARFAFVHTEPDEPATILYTSGTTGFPKGATLSHRNVRATVHAFNHLCHMRPGDQLLLTVPLFHCYGQNALLNAGLNVGSTIVMQRRFDLNESKQLIQEHSITKLFGVPTTFQLILDAWSREELGTVDYCFSAAATLPPPIGEAWQAKFGMPIFEGYGLTETAPFASYNHCLKHEPGSIGMPVDLVEMKVVDPDSGLDCPAGVAGEIVIRGPNVMLGYWNRPEETAASIRDGWFYSGDIGKTDETGYFYILDRLKDMISIGGMKVFPAEVERVLLESPAIADVAVVGLEDPVWGERVVAFVVARAEETLSLEAIRSYCQPHLASYKIPSAMELVDALPRNPAGKVLKTQLRKRALPSGGQASIDPSLMMTGSTGEETNAAAEYDLLKRFHDTHPTARHRMLSTFLQAEVQYLIGAGKTCDANSLFMDTGMDSMMMVQLRDRLQAEIGPTVELTPTLVFDHPRISDLARFLAEQIERNVVQTKASTGETRKPVAATNEPRSGENVESMSEQQALEALLREVDE